MHLAGIEIKIISQVTGLAIEEIKKILDKKD